LARRLLIAAAVAKRFITSIRALSGASGEGRTPSAAPGGT
jgi:hypothetical protein